MDRAEIELPCNVLSVEKRSYMKEGKSKEFRNVRLTMGNQVFDIGISEEAFDDVKNVQGKNTVLRVELFTFGNNLRPSMSVVGLAQ